MPDLPSLSWQMQLPPFSQGGPQSQHNLSLVSILHFSLTFDMCCASCSSGTRFTPEKNKTTGSHKLSVNFMSLTLQTLKSKLSARLSTTGGRLTSPHFSSLMHHAVASLSIHIALNLATKFPFKAFFCLSPPLGEQFPNVFSPSLFS